MFIVSAVYNQWVTSAKPVWGKFVLREPLTTSVSIHSASQFMTMCDGPFVMMCEAVTDQFSVHFIIAPGSIDGRPNVIIHAYTLSWLLQVLLFNLLLIFIYHKFFCFKIFHHSGFFSIFFAFYTKLIYFSIPFPSGHAKGAPITISSVDKLYNNPKL